MPDITLASGAKLRNIHPLELCVGRYCAIHNPSNHPLRDAPMYWYGGEIRHLARVCEHGYRHPDPDDIEFKKMVGEWITVEAIYSVHLMRENCDGCCQKEEKCQK